jgi:hypothetical protein
MILEVFEAQEPAVFRQELFNTLTTYYEEIQSMSGAGGRPQPKHFKRRMIAAGGTAGGGAQAAGGDDDEPPPPAADDAAPADPATPPRQERGKRACRSWWRKGAVVNKPACLVQCVGLRLNHWQANRLGPAGMQ